MNGDPYSFLPCEIIFKQKRHEGVKNEKNGTKRTARETVETDEAQYSGIPTVSSAPSRFDLAVGTFIPPSITRIVAVLAITKCFGLPPDVPYHVA